MSNGEKVPSAVMQRAIRSLAGFVVFTGVTLFLPAGRVTWVNGWLYLLAYVLLTIPSVVYLMRTNPEIFVARSRLHEGTKRWDKVVLAVLLPSLLAENVLAALDAGRFHWTSLPTWLIALGYVLLSLGFLVSVWAYRVNRFAEPGVRIQKDRAQTVIDTGPYALVRHPVYLGGLFIAWSIPLALGSLWAMIPAVVGSLSILARIVLEERLLRAELDGYGAYVERVRWRILPGIW